VGLVKTFADYYSFTLTPKMKQDIRKWRYNGSWRFVAEKFCTKYKLCKDLSGNQLFGIDLCEEAGAKYRDE
jgi:hypothetical protein